MLYLNIQVLNQGGFGKTMTMKQDQLIGHANDTSLYNTFITNYHILWYIYVNFHILSVCIFQPESNLDIMDIDILTNHTTNTTNNQGVVIIFYLILFCYFFYYLIISSYNTNSLQYQYSCSYTNIAKKSGIDVHIC